MLVYSTIYGGYDVPKPPRPHPDVSEWRLYTDDPNIYAPGWHVVFELWPEHSHPRMKAKARKCQPPLDEPHTLYLDASIRLRDPELLETARFLLKSAVAWAMYPHPERTTAAEEVEASVGMRKYAGLEARMRMQVASYHWGEERKLKLWAGGILVRNSSRMAVRTAGRDWLEECERWTYQDQLSLPGVLARHGIEPTPITLGSLWNNPHFTVEPHRSDL